MSQDDNQSESSGVRMLVYGIIAVIVLGIVYFATNQFFAAAPPAETVTEEPMSDEPMAEEPMAEEPMADQPAQ